MQRKIIFKDTTEQTELILPITPQSFSVETGIKAQTVNINLLGDVAFPGQATSASISLDVMFPKHNYPFCNYPLLYPNEPYKYVERFQNFIKNKRILRFVVSDTIVNLPVFVESIRFQEKDGTNDVYATITLKEYRERKAMKVESTSSASKERENSEETPRKSTDSHVVQKGDTLSGICRKYYGDSSSKCYNALAKLNGIKNPHLIFPGDVIKIVPKEQLV